VTRAWFDDLFDVARSTRALAILRIALGPVVLVHLGLVARDLVDGVTYRDRFWEPWVSWWQPPEWVQYSLVVVGLVAAVTMMIGLRSRLSAGVTLTCVAANFFLSQHHFRHNRAFLLYLLVTVTIGVSGRVLSWDARRRPRADDRDTIWPIWLMRFVASSVYFASGFSKLVDSDWVGGLVLWDRSVRYQQYVRDAAFLGPLADPVADIVTTRWVHAVTSPVAVAIELFVAFGLWFGPTRLAALWVAVFFHLSIEVAAEVEVFSLAALAALCLWVTPSTRDRTVVAPVRWVPWIRRFDWFARFVTTEGRAWEVVDRDGRRRSGRDAWWLVMSRLPLTFFFVAPFRAVTRPAASARQRPPVGGRVPAN
jgi:uncharacterized membrane protein YphA (DoxX/SURF4 family)